MSEIDCKTNLTIGGQKPLDSSAIEKLQAQIISPSQKIFVDGKNGSDNNDGSVYNKPVKTLDKAVSLIKKYTSNVEIELKTYTAEADAKYNTYTISAPIDNNSLGITTFSMHGLWDTYRTHHILANIVIPYGSTSTGIWKYNSNGIGEAEYRSWGWFLLNGFKDVWLYALNFTFPDEATTSTEKYKNAVVRNLQNSFTLTDNWSRYITLKKNCALISCINSSSIEFIKLGGGGTINGEGILLTTGYSSKLFTKSPKDTDGGYSYDGSTVGSMLITKYIKSDINFAGNVLGNNKGMGAGVKAIFIDGF